MSQELQVAVGLLQSAAVAGSIAFLVLALARFVFPPRNVSNPAIALAFVVAYCVGHALALGREFSLFPDRNWHWLFYIVPLACLAGMISTHPSAGRFQRCCFLVTVLALLAAGLLTNRSGLWASRPLLLVGMVVYLVAAWSLLEPLAARISPAPFAAAGWLAAAVLAGVLSEQISLTDGQIVGAVAGALAAIAIVAATMKTATPAPSLALPLLLALAGWTWKEFLMETRFWPLLAMPLAPAALWLTQLGPLSRRSPYVALAAGFGAALAILIAAALIVRNLGGEVYVY